MVQVDVKSMIQNSLTLWLWKMVLEKEETGKSGREEYPEKQTPETSRAIFFFEFCTGKLSNPSVKYGMSL